MQKNISLRVLPSEAHDEQSVKEYIAKATGVKGEDISGYHILKKSIDARGRQTWINLIIQAFIQEPFVSRPKMSFSFNDVSSSDKTVIIIGAGPAGIFAALKLIESGIKPIILERGKEVKARRRDLALLNKEGLINPDSNYCFGEGGAGTYSDGKLYTRSSKRGDVSRILNLFHHFGADEKILYESHPHIGTNKLPGIITAMRHKILECGGEVIFNKQVADFAIQKSTINKVITADGNAFSANACLLATGHSARDIFHLLHNRKILIENKPFALGVRIEHPQSIIDSNQYHCITRSEFLPAASYSLVHQEGERGVFSFCMCPGGIIAPASTSTGELVVNGWSPSKRNNPFANSGMVVTVNPKDLVSKSPYPDYELINNRPAHSLDTELGLMFFQQYVERKAFLAGGGKFAAPAQRLTDFCNAVVSADLPHCSYLPGVRSVSLDEVLPGFVFKSLQKAFLAFEKKMKGFLTREAIVVATESRTSSPVRIPRHPELLHHVQITNLYPCAEGAGYAGGIVSAAMDGEKVAATIAASLTRS